MATAAALDIPLKGVGPTVVVTIDPSFAFSAAFRLLSKMSVVSA